MNETKPPIYDQDKDLLKKYMFNKILSTFWHYQKEHFKGDSPNRWTFTVGRLHPEFFGFKLAIEELALQGLVFYSSESLQFGLTDRGIVFCKKKRAVA